MDQLVRTNVFPDSMGVHIVDLCLKVLIEHGLGCRPLPQKTLLHKTARGHLGQQLWITLGIEIEAPEEPFVEEPHPHGLTHEKFLRIALDVAARCAEVGVLRTEFNDRLLKNICTFVAGVVQSMNYERPRFPETELPWACFLAWVRTARKLGLDETFIRKRRREAKKQFPALYEQ